MGAFVPIFYVNFCQQIVSLKGFSIIDVFM